MNHITMTINSLKGKHNNSSIKFFYLLHLPKHSCQDFNKFCNKIRQENTFPSKRQTDTSTYFLYYDLVIKCLTIGSFQKNKNIILWLIKLENFENLPLACCCSKPKGIKFFPFLSLYFTFVASLNYINSSADPHSCYHLPICGCVQLETPVPMDTHCTPTVLKIIDYTMA